MRQTCSLCGNIFDDEKQVKFCSIQCREAYKKTIKWSHGKNRTMTPEQKEHFRKSLDPNRRQFTAWAKKFNAVRG